MVHHPSKFDQQAFLLKCSARIRSLEHLHSKINIVRKGSHVISPLNLSVAFLEFPK